MASTDGLRQVTDMIKYYTVVALMATTALISSLAEAARETQLFEVSLTIPNRSFYILPAEPGWIHQAQRLKWNPNTKSLSSVRKYFDVRHSSSAIEARLDRTAYLSNDRTGKHIALRVNFNGVELSPNIRPRQVVTAEAAAVGTRVLLTIEPQKPAGGYLPGDYSGNVILLFNAKAPGA